MVHRAPFVASILRGAFVLCWLTMVVSWPGCASSKGTTLYSAPDDRDFDSEIVVQAGFDEVWDRLLRGIRSAGWELRAENRDQGRIWFTVTGEKPEDLVDCGSLKRGAEEFAVARSYYKAYSDSRARHATRLEAGVSVDLKKAAAGTRVAADVWYVLDVDDRYINWSKMTEDQTTRMIVYDPELGMFVGKGRDIQGKTSVLGGHQRNTIHFTTARPDSVDWGTTDAKLFVTCRSTGRLEHSILALAAGEH